jgi:hypothetical protein
MVRAVPNAELLDAYLEGALALQERGASVITTTCGFLVSLQDAIATKLNVPFVASSLLLVPLILRLSGGGRFGIITANDEALTKRTWRQRASMAQRLWPSPGCSATRILLTHCFGELVRSTSAKSRHASSRRQPV